LVRDAQEIALETRIICLCRFWASDDHKAMPFWKGMTVQANNLLEPSAHLVTYNRSANFFRNGEAKSAVGCPVFRHEDKNMGCSDAASAALSAKKMLAFS